MKSRFSLALLLFSVISSAAFAARFQIEYDEKAGDHYVSKLHYLQAPERFSRNFTVVDDAMQVLRVLKAFNSMYVRIGFDGVGYYVARKKSVFGQERMTQTYETVCQAVAAAKLISGNWDCVYSIKYDGHKYYVVKYKMMRGKFRFSDPFDTLELAVAELKKIRGK